MQFLVASSPQPPIDPTVYNVATIGQPVRIDPARAYDTASCELLQNVYQTLIWWTDKHPIAFTSGVGYNLTLSDYPELDQYGPVLCTEVPTEANGRLIVNSSGSYWRFTINTNALFQPWVDQRGNTQPARNITAADVVYSFRRQVVYDSIHSPVWMWMTPAFGYASWRSIRWSLRHVQQQDVQKPSRRSSGRRFDNQLVLQHRQRRLLLLPASLG